jgi:hypothetical protein
MQIKILKKILNHTIGIHVVKHPELEGIGITNESDDSYYTPFFDWDGVDIKVVYRDLTHVARVFNLCRFAILCSSEEDFEGRRIGNYHAMGIDKMIWQDHRDMLRHTRCDRLYRWPPTSLRTWVLRVSAKVDLNKEEFKKMPKLIDLICFNKNCKKDHSNAHIQFLRKHYKAKIPNNIKTDKYKDLEYCEYKT